MLFENIFQEQDGSPHGGDLFLLNRKLHFIKKT